MKGSMASTTGSAGSKPAHCSPALPLSFMLYSAKPVVVAPRRGRSSVPMTRETRHPWLNAVAHPCHHCALVTRRPAQLTCPPSGQETAQKAAHCSSGVMGSVIPSATQPPVTLMTVTVLIAVLRRRLVPDACRLFDVNGATAPALAKPWEQQHVIRP